MSLPVSFIEKYTQLLGDEAQAFFKSFEEPAVAGFRTNPLKASQKQYSDAIDGMPWSYYGKVSGKSLDHVMGLVYSQEPAAQVVGQVAAPEKGMRVLDLAAAPGGKSTHLLSYLQNTGLLVSNEISKKRSKILVENIERFGARNVLVTNESAQRLAQIFPSFFDVIVLDAPCSGEGMFRKDPEAMQYWSIDYPRSCSMVQREILEDAVRMLAPGGRLVYSTCTWSVEENEDVVAWLLDTYPELTLEPIVKQNGMVAGIDQPETARMYPHRFRGEGQFVASFKNTSGVDKAFKYKPSKSNLNREQLAYWRAFEKECLKVSLSGVLQVFGDELYLLPEGLPDLSKVKIARNGLHLGTFKTKRFEPSFALGVALWPKEVKRTVTITPDEAQSYLRGEALSCSHDGPNGWYQVVVEGNGLGFAKWVNGTLKNSFPKGLRLK